MREIKMLFDAPETILLVVPSEQFRPGLRTAIRRSTRNCAHGHYVFPNHEEQAGGPSCGFSEL